LYSYRPGRKKSRLRGFFVLQREDYFFASGAAGAGAAGAAAAGAASAGAAAGAGAGAGFGSSFLPQAAKATANIAASNSDFFICKFL